MLREDSRPGTLSVEITSWLHLGGLREALPVLRRNKQPLMKLHCDIMGIMKAVILQGPGTVFIIDYAEIGFAELGQQPREECKSVLKLPAGSNQWYIPLGPCARGSCRWDGLSEPHNCPTTDVRPAPPSAV